MGLPLFHKMWRKEFLTMQELMGVPARKHQIHKIKNLPTWLFLHIKIIHKLSCAYKFGSCFFCCMCFFFYTFYFSCSNLLLLYFCRIILLLGSLIHRLWRVELTMILSWVGGEEMYLAQFMKAQLVWWHLVFYNLGEKPVGMKEHITINEIIAMLYLKHGTFMRAE